MAQEPLRVEERKKYLGYYNRAVNSSVGKALDKTFHQVRRILGVLREGKNMGCWQEFPGGMWAGKAEHKCKY